MKEFSARKFMVVAIISTYCLSIVSSVLLTVTGKMTIETFLAMQTGFGGLAMYIVKAYFDDKVRIENQQNGGQK